MILEFAAIDTRCDDTNEVTGAAQHELRLIPRHDSDTGIDQTSHLQIVVGQLVRMALSKRLLTDIAPESDQVTEKLRSFPYLFVR